MSITKTPWHIAYGTMPNFDGSPIITIYGDEAYKNNGGDIVCVIVDKTHVEPHDIDNANLILSAPGMYEALKQVLVVLDSNDAPWWLDYPDKGGFDREAITHIINKAEGKDA